MTYGVWGQHQSQECCSEESLRLQPGSLCLMGAPDPLLSKIPPFTASFFYLPLLFVHSFLLPKAALDATSPLAVLAGPSPLAATQDPLPLLSAP